MRLINGQNREQIWRVQVQFSIRIGHEGWQQIKHQVENLVANQVRNQVYYQMRNQIDC